jgi:F-type H+-transporting ATPase subunit delta
MKISKQARREAKELFRSCLAQGLLDDNKVRQAVQLVLQGKPRGYLAILSHFARLVKLDVERRTARIESAVPLPADLQAQVQTSLAGIYGRGLDISFTQNLALIGGMRIKVGCDVFDGSVQARLAALEESFN